MTGSSGRRSVALAGAGVWSLLVVLALVSTLRSLATDDFDGLNNLFQLPLSLPWCLVPVGALYAGEPWAHELDVWVLAGFGFLNGAIIYLLIMRVAARAVA